MSEAYTHWPFGCAATRMVAVEPGVPIMAELTKVTAPVFGSMRAAKIVECEFSAQYRNALCVVCGPPPPPGPGAGPGAPDEVVVCSFPQPPSRRKTQTTATQKNTCARIA